MNGGGAFYTPARQIQQCRACLRTFDQQRRRHRRRIVASLERRGQRGQQHGEKLGRAARSLTLSSVTAMLARAMRAATLTRGVRLRFGYCKASSGRYST